ncbi:MAG: MBL fold metallo-hydrolase [Chlorobi bacterium]|nr:MBL fold metallo-hydrolase [Chlorobiota bacterium]
MNKKKKSKYPLIWKKGNLFIEIFCSIPNIATGILLRTDKTYFVVDPGDGILRDLNRNLNPSEILEISDVFITHGHHDHIGGLWSFLTYMTVMQREKPIDIFYPEGSLEIESIIAALLQVYSRDIKFKINLRKIADEKSFSREGMKIKPFKVNHKEPDFESGKAVPVPSLGYKFLYEGKSICYGGDTAFSDNLAKHAKDSDLAIIEAGAVDDSEMELHMTPEQAESIGESAKEYFLVHVPEKR